MLPIMLSPISVIYRSVCVDAESPSKDSSQPGFLNPDFTYDQFVCFDDKIVNRQTSQEYQDEEVNKLRLKAESATRFTTGAFRIF